MQVAVVLGSRREHDAGQSEGEANTADPEGTDPVSANTDGGWVTPAGRVAIHVGSSVRDIRLTDTVTLAAGTCGEDSDVASADRDADNREDAARAVASRR